MRAQVAAAASSLSAGWKQLGAHVPALWARSPAGSDSGSPVVKAASEPPRKEAAFARASPAASASKPEARRWAAAAASHLSGSPRTPQLEDK